MKLAIVFPGQGSQAVGMLAGYAEHSLVRETFVEAGQILGQDLWALVEDGPAEALNETVNTQPVMLTADVAVYRAWRAAGGAEASVMAGHSLGEYAALVAAGAITFADALPLVRFRAQAMQQAVPQEVGAMAAIMGLDDEGVGGATPEAIRAALGRQAASPVRWVETIQAFVAQGVTHIIECGPGAVLTGLARRIAPGVEVLPLNDANAIAAAITATAS